MKNIVSPSILSADFANLESDIKKVTDNGALWVHIDVMDGHFVPNITIGAPVVKSIRKVTNCMLDVHLMIDNPLKYIPDFINAGADVITFHMEASNDATDECIKLIKEKGLKAGISIKPGTCVSAIEKYIKDIDLVLVMTVEPGFSGQSFMRDAADKIKDVKFLKDKYGLSDLIIQVDGGINDETAKICANLGAKCFVAGNYVYKNKDIALAIKNILYA